MVVGTSAPEGSRARSVADLRPGFGPLGGLHAALSAAEHAWVAVVACDMPFLASALWPFLLKRTEGVLVVIPASPAGVEPLAGIYHRDLIPALGARLDQERLSLHELSRTVPSRIVPWAEVRTAVPASAFLNANRAEDLP